MPNIRRILVWACVALLMAGGLLWSFWPHSIKVEMATISYGSMRVEVSDEGRTRVREKYQVSAPVTGRLLRIEKHPGDDVVGGKTIVADLLPMSPSFLDLRSQSQAEAAIKSAEAAQKLAASELEGARAQLSFTRSDLERATKLAASGIISRADFERARLARDSAISRNATADAALKARQYDLENARALLIDPARISQTSGNRPSIKLVAPANGKILRVLHEDEAVVTAGTPILEVGDPRQLEILVPLVSEEAVKVHPGDVARITDWGGAGVLGARVRRVEPSGFTKVSALGVEEQRVNVLLDFADRTSNLASIADGFRVIVNIVIWQQPRVLRLPATAMFRRGDGWAVFVVRGGRARLQPVQVGAVNDDFAELRAGAEEGEQVIVHPSDQVGDGTAVHS
ncbi:MAG: HlyD family efflux transporter periplasmic adaptor subunit [Alphaproteobacteria bacterium]|nr:HlyD family efflux transporter periplasmic adaptor subunit [Alphaproteobacteria bacterium]